MKISDTKNTSTPTELISAQISSLADWRGPLLAHLRKLVLEAAPGITEEWKWGSPVWSQAGMVCSAGVFKDHVRLNFFKGASLEDPHGLFNAGLDAKAMRAINFGAGSQVDESALKDLIRTAVQYNVSGGKKLSA